MESPIPSHAERITLRGETAWLWRTDLGWSVFQWPYRFDLENVEREARFWHTIDGVGYSRGPGEFEGWLVEREDGFLEFPEFLVIAERCREALWKRYQPRVPPSS